MSVNIKQIEVGHMGNFTYIVYDKDNAVIIDPSWGHKEIREFLKQEKIKPVAVLLTHGHYDHTNDAPLISEEFKIPVYIHRADEILLENKPVLLKYIDTDRLNFNSISFEVIHTPGHTPGGVCYITDKYIFTGDTLFIGVCGRVDLPYSNPRDMRQSLIKLSKLADDMIVYPGHQYNGTHTTIGKEKKTNFFMKTAVNSEDDFLSII